MFSKYVSYNCGDTDMQSKACMLRNPLKNLLETSCKFKTSNRNNNLKNIKYTEVNSSKTIA